MESESITTLTKIGGLWLELRPSRESTLTPTPNQPKLTSESEFESSPVRSESSNFCRSRLRLYEKTITPPPDSGVDSSFPNFFRSRLRVVPESDSKLFHFSELGAIPVGLESKSESSKFSRSRSRRRDLLQIFRIWFWSRPKFSRVGVVVDFFLESELTPVSISSHFLSFWRYGT